MEYHVLETLQDLEKAVLAIPEEKRDRWLDAFWTLYSQGVKILVRY